ncbi:hypothetical protein Tco_1391710 [Tanacetum coccineum]
MCARCRAWFMRNSILTAWEYSSWMSNLFRDLLVKFGAGCGAGVLQSTVAKGQVPGDVVAAIFLSTP